MLFLLCIDHYLNSLFFLLYTELYRSDAEGLCPPSYQENLDPPLGGVYHLVVEGKSFEIIREHCPQVMERVRLSTCLSASYGILVNGVTSMGTQNSGEGSKYVQTTYYRVRDSVKQNIGWMQEDPRVPHPLYETLVAL